MATAEFGWTDRGRQRDFARADGSWVNCLWVGGLIQSAVGVCGGSGGFFNEALPAGRGGRAFLALADLV